MKRLVICTLLITLILGLLTGCIPGGNSYSVDRPANVLSGIWHGWIAPFSLLFGILNGKTRIYESVNTGWWYDFGFYVSVISGFGGISLFRKKKRKKCDD